MTTRRKLVIAMGAGALAPLASFSQTPGKVWRVGFLAQRRVEFVDADSIFGPFTQGMRELGYTEGKNLAITWRSSEGNIERLTELAAELVRLNPDVLVTNGTPASVAAQKATAAIPIVMVNVADPLATGLVRSLARPGGNSTALSTIGAELGPKLLELLHTMAPKAQRVAVLVNPGNAVAAPTLENLLAASAKLGLKMQPVEARTAQEIVTGFGTMARQKAGALVVMLDPFFVQQKDQIAELAAKHRLPSIAGHGEYAQAGGLMIYGQTIRENYKRAAIYVDKIFNGTKAGELPVEMPTRFEMFINMKTAKALGLKVPQSILIQATTVIE